MELFDALMLLVLFLSVLGGAAVIIKTVAELVPGASVYGLITSLWVQVAAYPTILIYFMVFTKDFTNWRLWAGLAITALLYPAWIEDAERITRERKAQLEGRIVDDDL